MSDHERGAYSPQNDAPLAFDARRSPSGGGGFPTTLIISLVVLALLVVAIVMFYRSGIRSAGEGPATVGAPVAQIKSPAPAGAQPSDEATGLQIYKTEGAPSSSAPPAPAFSAPPEEPKARPTTPVAVHALPPAPPPSPAVVAASGATTPAKPPPAPSQAPSQAPAKDEIGALLDKSPAAPSKPAKPVAIARAAAPTPAAPVSAGPAPGGAGASAQIGAYSSGALAAEGWSDVAGAFPADMTGKGKHFEPVTKDGKTLYRAAVTGFASKQDAQAFCAKLKAAGRACIVK